MPGFTNTTATPLAQPICQDSQTCLLGASLIPPCPERLFWQQPEWPT